VSAASRNAFEGVSAERASLRRLLIERAYEARPVVLSSGQKSDFYIDCKKAALLGQGHALIGAIFNHLAQQLEASTDARFACVGGMSIGADPLCSATSLIAYQSGRELPCLYVRKEPKGHGSGRQVEGTEAVPSGAEVFVLEDVITTGGSTLRAVRALRAAGYTCRHVGTLVDREAGGAQALLAEGLTLHPVFVPADLRAADPES